MKIKLSKLIGFQVIVLCIICLSACGNNPTECIEVNSKEECKIKYEEYEKRYNDTLSKTEKLKEIRAKKKTKADRIDVLIQKLNSSEQVFDVFDESLWALMVEKVVAYDEERFVFHLYNGMEVEG